MVKKVTCYPKGYSFLQGGLKVVWKRVQLYVERYGFEIYLGSALGQDTSISHCLFHLEVNVGSSEMSGRPKEKLK